ncbi:MAG: COG4315 family predicted lipoprotein [Acidimicrobiales bacterium]
MPRTLAAAITALALFLGACGDDGNDDAISTTTEAAGGDSTTTTEAPADDEAPAGDTAVDVGDTSLGQVLVDGTGRTLYVFGNDQPGVSNCEGGCLDNWPPATVEEGFAVGPGLDQAQFGTITRSDGTVQLAVNDLPLYLFANDAAPGDVDGQGVGDVWWVVAPDGTPIEG